MRMAGFCHSGGLDDAARFDNRMDRGHVEPGDGLHEDQPGCKFCYADRMAKRLQAMGRRIEMVFA